MADITSITNGEAGSSVRTSLNQAITAVNTVGGTATAVTGTGSVVLATSPTLVTPALGTPSALVGTNISGTAANLTAGHVTTNANLTGPITSVGNATTVANGANGSFTSSDLVPKTITVTNGIITDIT